MRGHGRIRQSQIITTYGPGSLIDLPTASGIMGGLETWPNESSLEEIIEPRLGLKLRLLTGISNARLFAPPPRNNDPSQPDVGIGIFRFPEWFLVQEPLDGHSRGRSRRLVHRKALDEKGRFEGNKVVPTRFLRACPKGHVDDIDWHWFVHVQNKECPRTRQLWLDEQGTGGDLANLIIKCECGQQRKLSDATEIDGRPLGLCNGRRPWLGYNTNEECKEPYRLLTRTASNAYFPQVVSVLSLPNRGGGIDVVVQELWEILQIVEEVSDLKFARRNPTAAAKLAGIDDEAIFSSITQIKKGSTDLRPVKHVELEAILAVAEGFGDDVPIDPNFHARRLPEYVWRKRPELTVGIESVIQVHRLREVAALIGFTRFEAYTPDINGEFDTDVERASLSLEANWLPAIENRGEGIFIQLRAEAIAEWLAREGVAERLDSLRGGHRKWMLERKAARPFPGGAYVLLHTLSHLLIQSMAMRCGYPASSIIERIYANSEISQYGILLFTGSSDAEGTLGGLVQQARYIEEHLVDALRVGSLCSNDPVCSHHNPETSLEKRYLQGASCHGCALTAETSCEMRNDYLDRALVVPILGVRSAAFFQEII